MKFNPEQENIIRLYLRKKNYTVELFDHILKSGIS